VSTQQHQKGSQPENWRLKLVTDAIGNALGTGIAAASAVIYGTVTGLIQPDPRVPVGTLVLLVAVLWSLALWNAPSWLEALRSSGRFPWIPRLHDLLVWALGQFLAWVVFSIALDAAGISSTFATWAVIFGFAIVVALELLEILHRRTAGH
jgi:hypothetical protein